MNSDLVYHPNTSRITYEIIEGEVIIVDFDTGVYYSINALGSVIFNWIAHGANLGDVHKVIGTHFRVPETDVVQAVDAFIDTLLQDAIISPRDSSGENRILNNPELSYEDLPDSATFEAPRLEKYTDMQELLLLDPIHEVDEEGWPFTKQDNDKPSE